MNYDLLSRYVTDQGKIKRVRGVAWAVRVSPSVVNRMVEVAKVRASLFTN